MMLQRGRLPKSLSNYCLTTPAGVFRLPKFESTPLLSRWGFFSKDGAISSIDGANDGRCCSYVPKGCFEVYVGKGGTMRKFAIPLTYLSHAIFKALLKKAEEEFGFSNNGGIRLPCESFRFEHTSCGCSKEGPLGPESGDGRGALEDLASVRKIGESYMRGELYVFNAEA